MAADWTVYDYEVDMFKSMYVHCRSDVLASYSPHIRNAIVESLLLHTRNIVDILLSRDTEPDAINLKTLLPGFSPTQLGALAKLYGSGKAVGSPCWTLNKMLVHSTSLRTDHFNYTAMLETLRPVTSSCLDEIANERNK
jgi:hypothetical protein